MTEISLSLIFFLGGVYVVIESSVINWIKLKSPVSQGSYPIPPSGWLGCVKLGRNRLSCACKDIHIHRNYQNVPKATLDGLKTTPLSRHI